MNEQRKLTRLEPRTDVRAARRPATASRSRGRSRRRRRRTAGAGGRQRIGTAADTSRGSLTGAFPTTESRWTAFGDAGVSSRYYTARSVEWDLSLRPVSSCPLPPSMLLRDLSVSSRSVESKAEERLVVVCLVYRSRYAGFLVCSMFLVSFRWYWAYRIDFSPHRAGRDC